MAVKSFEKRGLLVEVRNNNIEKAIRLLNRKVKQEGILKEIRARQFFEKPSTVRRRKAAEGTRRVAKAKRLAAENA